MREYLYVFEKEGTKYYVYAASKDSAIRKYLRQNDLKAIPKGTTIVRTNA